MSSGTGSGPLAGIVVADFTQILAGPYATQMLADAGADVIKIEPPKGEFSRIRGPRRLYEDGGVTAYSAAINRGKRSVELDLKNSEGLRLAKEIVDRSDIVIENFSPGTMERLGLDFKKLRVERPVLITCSISLFGGSDRAGDLANRGGLAVIAEAEAGVSAMALSPDGSPVRNRLALGDMCSGLAAYSAILTAIVARDRTGVGTHLDITMVGTLLSINSIEILSVEFLENQPVQKHAQQTAGYGFFPASDGYVAIGVNTDILFARLTKAMGQEWMAEDRRYRNCLERDARAPEVNAIVREWSSSHTMDEVVEALTDVGVPGGVVATARNVLASGLITRLGLMEQVDDGFGGETLSPVAPHTYRPDGQLAIPRVGQHAKDILLDVLGIDEAQFEQLREQGAFGSAAA